MSSPNLIRTVRSIKLHPVDIAAALTIFTAIVYVGIKNELPLAKILITLGVYAMIMPLAMWWGRVFRRFLRRRRSSADEGQ